MAETGVAEEGNDGNDGNDRNDRNERLRKQWQELRERSGTRIESLCDP